MALPYGWPPIYQFPEAEPFRGGQILNPYAGLKGQWQRANFHAHGQAWGGLTSGEQPSAEVAARYRSLGYDVPGVSNYHHIAAHHGVDTLPIYEHGYNINKRHQLAIGARRVEWFDLLFWQSLSQQQYIIDRVRDSAELLALSHPLTRDAYGADDLKSLTGYQLMEVLNGGHSSESSWDAALSSGRAVWAIGNDDTHDLNDRERTAISWTMIDAPSAAAADVIGALSQGRAVAMVRTAREVAPDDPMLAAVHVHDGQLTIRVTGAPSTFVFIGQGGTVKKEVKGVTEAHYQLSPADSYIRTVIASDNVSLLLNPVLRYDGTPPSEMRATVDLPRTWLLRGSVAAGAGLALLYLFRRRTPARRG